MPTTTTTACACCAGGPACLGLCGGCCFSVGCIATWHLTTYDSAGHLIYEARGSGPFDLTSRDWYDPSGTWEQYDASTGATTDSGVGCRLSCAGGGWGISIGEFGSGLPGTYGINEDGGSNGCSGGTYYDLAMYGHPGSGKIGLTLTITGNKCCNNAGTCQYGAADPVTGACV